MHTITPADADSADEALKAARVPVSGILPAEAARRRRFDNEDEEDDVKDDWGASSEEEDKKPKAATKVVTAKKKMSFKQKIAQKEEEERTRADLGLAHGQEKGEVDVLEYDPIAARRAAKAAQIKADVGNATDLLGVTDLGDDDEEGGSSGDAGSGAGATKPAGAPCSAAAASTASAVSLRAWASSSTPKNKAQWDALAASLYAQTLKQHALKDPQGFAKYLVPGLTKQIIAPLRDVDVRKLSTSVKGWAEEKTAAEQTARRAGGNKPQASATGAAAACKPKSIGISSAKNNVDLEAYGREALDDADAYDDELDFM